MRSINKKYLIYFLLFMALCPVYETNAEEPLHILIPKKDSRTENLVKHEDELLALLAHERDPEKRAELITQLLEVQSQYNMPPPGSPPVQKKAAAPSPTTIEREVDIPFVPFSTYAQYWDSYSSTQKSKYCYKAADACENSNLEYCRIIITKCSDYIKPEDYNDIKEHFGK